MPEFNVPGARGSVSALFVDGPLAGTLDEVPVAADGEPAPTLTRVAGAEVVTYERVDAGSPGARYRVADVVPLAMS